MKKMVLFAFIVVFSANAQNTILADAIHSGELYNLDSGEPITCFMNVGLEINFIKKSVILTIFGAEETYEITEIIKVNEGKNGVQSYYLIGKNEVREIAVVYDFTDKPIGILFMPEQKYVLYVYPIKSN